MSYLCRRVLLKNTQDETGGHVRLESGAGGCNVEAQASAAPAGAHLLLLRRDGTVRDAGTLNAGRLQILLRGEDVATLTGATVALGGRALLFGGEGISAEAARRAAAQSAQAPNGETRLASREASAHVPAQEAAGPAAQQVPASAHVPAQEAAGPAEDGNGWMFRSAGDGQRFDGMLYAGGKPVLQAEGYLSPYSPQPPPGLPGARWQDGFFIDFQKIDG